ncbi:hypothetical protein MWU52_04505 [Jannaschia sp. S6380]|uniref:hypothetical protein n=1 Tax=Jannaschia sp. S6380 TaxID=2926408 RepID=UPI001FF5400D|nr:hypothetical protein [Jannaschia sp. S6380]MCK0166806.1 hypothetical protein [Jannaschia sp. S6380]
MFTGIMTPVDRRHIDAMEKARTASATPAREIGSDVTFVSMTTPAPPIVEDRRMTASGPAVPGLSFSTCGTNDGRQGVIVIESSQSAPPSPSLASEFANAVA